MRATSTLGSVVARPALDHVRRDRGLTVRGTAARAGLPHSTVAHLFSASIGKNPRRERKRISYEIAQAIAEVLEVPMGDVFTHPNGDPIQGAERVD